MFHFSSAARQSLHESNDSIIIVYPYTWIEQKSKTPIALCIKIRGTGVENYLNKTRVSRILLLDKHSFRVCEHSKRDVQHELLFIRFSFAIKRTTLYCALAQTQTVSRIAFKCFSKYNNNTNELINGASHTMAA